MALKLSTHLRLALGMALDALAKALVLALLAVALVAAVAVHIIDALPRRVIAADATDPGLDNASAS